MFIYKVLIFILLLSIECSSRTLVEVCPQLPKETLTKILASALNPRYMSIDEPFADQETTLVNNKRESPKDFYVDSNYHKELTDQPAWEVEYVPNTEKRLKRASTSPEFIKQPIKKPSKQRDPRQIFLDSITPGKDIFKSRPWECKAVIKWIDLGYNYFPRYLRSVECMKKDCWYGHYKCKARSFTVKVLHRRNGECARLSEKLLATVDQKSGQYTELWVWDEKPINFCCDCVMS